MTFDATLASWLRLAHVQGLGNQGMLRLLKALGSPENILSSSLSTLSEHVPTRVARAIRQSSEVELRSVENWLSDSSNSVLTLSDPAYPQALLNTVDPPVLLYVKGNSWLLNIPTLAIVGSRNATVQGLRNATAFAHSLSDSGLCIASGLAHGIDAAAHAGALAGTSSTIAVVGTGLDRIYPAKNRDLAHELSLRGCIISEFPLGTPPLAANFPRRNRIISGLSLGCLVVEASIQSGSLITARLALEQGREVFAIPGSIHSPQAKGCHSLIKQGAKLVESTEDILCELGLASIPSQPSSHNYSAISTLEYISFEPISLESIAAHANLTVAELSAILLQLEIDGQITSLPGGLYQRIV